MPRKKKKPPAIYQKPIAHIHPKRHPYIDYTSLFRALRQGTGKKSANESSGK